ncbi:MAG TPA: hypothetical protein VES66_02710 [Terriglobales bacterium]|nr:hypothetical protein [Terriglobales bacterium]
MTTGRKRISASCRDPSKPDLGLLGWLQIRYINFSRLGEIAISGQIAERSVAPSTIFDELEGRFGSPARSLRMVPILVQQMLLPEPLEPEILNR